MEEVKGVVTESGAEVINSEILTTEDSALKQEISSLKQEISELKNMLFAQISNTSQTHVSGFQTNLPSKTPSFPLFSTGNEGVQTDKQTDIQQTDKQGLEALSTILSEMKIKFRNLTKQEFKVFSAIYILGQQQSVDYPLLAEKLKLSEGCIRDYIMKMERKGIPISKEKVNNKKVFLTVHSEIKQLMPLEMIMSIREPRFR